MQHAEDFVALTIFKIFPLNGWFSVNVALWSLSSYIFYDTCRCRSRRVFRKRFHLPMSRTMIYHYEIMQACSAFNRNRLHSQRSAHLIIIHTRYDFLSLFFFSVNVILWSRSSYVFYDTCRSRQLFEMHRKGQVFRNPLHGSWFPKEYKLYVGKYDDILDVLCAAAVENANRFMADFLFTPSVSRK